jgi:hypothetical protein
MSGTPRPRILWSKVICKEPGDYIGWPTIGRTADGELMVVFSGERDTHVCPYGKTQLVRSRDAGGSWSPPETINNTPLDDRDAGILVTRSGVIVVSWFTGTGVSRPERYRERFGAEVVNQWQRHYKKIGPEVIDRWRGSWTRRSTDGGLTWEPAVKSIASAPHGPIQLRDGRLLYVGNAMIDGERTLASVESIDDGRSWRFIGNIPVPEEDAEQLTYYEPHAVELQDARIVCLWRYEEREERELSVRDSHLRKTESRDGGRTWSVTRPTSMWGYPPHLLRLNSGDLLATYGYRRPGFGQRACLSHDEGGTWDIDREIILRDDADNGDLGYPASLELEPGELLTVYYQIDQPGEKPSLIATRWSLL